MEDHVIDKENMRRRILSCDFNSIIAKNNPACRHTKKSRDCLVTICQKQLFVLKNKENRKHLFDLYSKKHKEHKNIILRKKKINIRE